MKGVLVRYIAVLLMASITGCGTARVAHEQPVKAPYRLPAGAKVALAVGQSDFKITYSDHLDYSVGEVSTSRKSYTVEATKNIPEGILKCTIEGLFVGFPLCALVVPVMFPTLGLIGDGVATVKEAAQNGSKENTEKPKSADELAKERKAAEEKLAAMQDALRKHLAGIETALAQRPLIVRAQGYARESGVGDFLVLTNNSPAAGSERPDYENQVNYVFDLAITRIEIRPGVTTGPGEYAVEFTGAGRLIRLQDNAVVDEFTETSSRVVPLEPLTTTNARIVSERLDVAIQDLAEMLVKYWIKPTMKGSR